MTETIHLIYEIAATAALILGGGWKLISFLNKRLNKLEVDLALRMDSKFDLVNHKLDILSKQVSQLGGMFDQLDADTIALDRRLIVLETRQEAKSNFSESPAHAPIARRSRRSRPSQE